MRFLNNTALPKVVREALGLEEGDEVVFHVEGDRAVLARTPDFLALAGVAIERREHRAAFERFGLPRPPRVSRAEATSAIPSGLLSFMDESRRLDNRRLKATGFAYRYTSRETVLRYAEHLRALARVPAAHWDFLDRVCVDYLETDGPEMPNRNGDSLTFLRHLTAPDIIQDVFREEVRHRILHVILPVDVVVLDVEQLGRVLQLRPDRVGNPWLFGLLVTAERDLRTAVAADPSLHAWGPTVGPAQRVALARTLEYFKVLRLARADHHTPTTPREARHPQEGPT